jgi:hypothetical protein
MWWTNLLIAGGALLFVLAMSMWYRNTTRLYRTAILNDTLIRERRSVFMPWRWFFNRSEEDRLNRMRNRLVSLRQEQATLTKMIPEEEDRIKKAKDKLRDNSDSRGPVVRDVWSPRREPVVLHQSISVGGSGKKKDKPPPKRKPLLELHQAQ